MIYMIKLRNRSVLMVAEQVYDVCVGVERLRE